MRTLFVFCAVALGMGCDASATEVGLASFYGAQGLTAAHRSLPMGSRVKVLNLDNGRSVIVRIVDRGPFIQGRIMDVSTRPVLVIDFDRRADMPI
jgi:rare lipoprotein A